MSIAGHGQTRRSNGRRRGGEPTMVAEVTFTSYYGRPILKAAPWASDVPAYLFLGGLAGGSALLAAAADVTGRAALRRTGRLGAFGAVAASFALLIHDLGRPMRFLNMLRVAKPTSPMSVGTWILAVFAPVSAVAAAAELHRSLPRPPTGLGGFLQASARPAGLAAAAVGSAVASYTAVLICDTATPAWHDGYREMPFVFVGSAATAAGGLGMLSAPVREAGPARRLAMAGALLEIAAQHRMESSMGMTAEPMRVATAGIFIHTNKALTAIGALGAAFSGRSRSLSAASGLALLAGSALGRFGIFEAGQQSARDPRYTVVPQRERLTRSSTP